MIPTKQTVLHDPDNGLVGNCFYAALASLLHVPIEDIPLFADPDTWTADLNAWLRPLGLGYLVIGADDRYISDFGIKEMWHDVAGDTNRGPGVKHACVAKDGVIVFDPSPCDSGLSEITHHGIFIALEPWQWVEKRLRSDR